MKVILMSNMILFGSDLCLCCGLVS